MQRVFMAFVTICLLATVSYGVTAQDDAAPPLGSNPIGEPLTIYNAQGDEAAQVTVTGIVDPFDDFGQFSAPQQDERYVLVTIEVENTGERPFEFRRFDFSLLDTLGRLTSLGFVSRSDQSTVTNPDLEDANMLPGESASGALTYRIPHDAELAQVIFSFYDDVQQLYLLADLTGSPPLDEAA